MKKQEREGEPLEIYIYNEKDYLTLIQFQDLYFNFKPKFTWINEKLLFMRIWWGRIGLRQRFVRCTANSTTLFN